jgi:hypothetical protein
MTAGMGQLQALSYLTFNGKSLLGQIKALSTVSGGSWLGVPYIFLPQSGPPDTSFLGSFNPNIGSATLSQLAVLPAGNAATPITSIVFSPLLLAVQAVLLYETLNVPADMLWQTIIALNILTPVDLYVPGSNLAPTDFFTFDSQTLSAITNANPSLANETVYLVASGATRTPRPFYACNMGMLVHEPNTAVLSLAPVQAGPFITSIVGSPSGTDDNGLAPGGGGVTSFAFDSNFASANGSTATVNQTRQWALTDIAGTSSAFFAEMLQNQFAQWEQNPLQFFETLYHYGSEILKWIEGHLFGDARASAKAFVYRNTAVTAAGALGAASHRGPGRPHHGPDP